MSDSNTVTVDPFEEERPKETHFHARMAVLNIRENWAAWNGYKLANYFYDAEYEYFCVRNGCGTYDICGMQKYFVTGKDAEAMLNRMVTRDISEMNIDRVTYLVWCTDEGRLIDDGTVFKLGHEHFMLTCGSPSLAWLEKSCYGFKDVSIVDMSERIAALALQGPTSCEVLKKMGLKDINTLKPFGIKHFPFGASEDKPLMVSRTGFTGDLGYELWIKPELALEMWDALYEAGEDYHIQPFGEAALNMARMEAGFIMPLMEFNEALKTIHFRHDHTPFQLSLDWLVDFKKPHFNGRAALLKEKRDGPEYTLVKLDIEGNKPAEECNVYSDKGCENEIGYVTSAMWSPVVKANIALAMVKTRYLKGEIWAEIYYNKELRSYTRVSRCTVKEKPFWGHPRSRVTPPLPY